MLEKQFYWVAFISQTGSEVYEISKALGFWPDKIVSSNSDSSKLNQWLRQAVEDGTVQLITLLRPTVQDYFQVIPPNAVVTLNGYLKIVPPEVCDAYTIFNGHPGLITEYPELKGKDPQQKAFDLKHPRIGCVIHEVTKELDGGKILAESFWEIGYVPVSLPMMFAILHDMSVALWIQFLKERLV